MFRCRWYRCCVPVILVIVHKLESVVGWAYGAERVERGFIDFRALVQ